MSRVSSRLAVIALGCTLVWPLAACGNGEKAQSPATGSTKTGAAATGVDLSGKSFDDLSTKSAVDVEARDNNFVAPYVEIKAGTKVTFTNRGRNQHDVVPAVKGAFADIPVDHFEPGTSVTVTFAKPGDYPYYCSLHGNLTKGMVGAIRVVK